MEFEDLDNDNIINNVEPEITPILEDANIDIDYSETQINDANDNSSKTENKPVDNLTNYNLNKKIVYNSNKKIVDNNISKGKKIDKILSVLLGIAATIVIIFGINLIFLDFAIKFICGSMQ